MSEKIELKPVKYDYALAEISKMKAEAEKLQILDLKDTAGYQAVRESRMDAKTKRIATENRRKDYKSLIIGYGKTVDGDATVIKDALKEIEDMQQEKTDLIDNAKAKIKRDKEEAEIKRAEKMIQQSLDLSKQLSIEQAKGMSDDEFVVWIEMATKEFEADQARIAAEEKAKKDEEEKLAKQKTDQAKVQEEQDKKNAELKAREDELFAKELAIKRAEEDKLAAINNAKQIEKAKKDALREAKEKEARKIELQKNRESRLPDIKKIENYKKKISEILVPDFIDCEIERRFVYQVNENAKNFNSLLEELIGE